MRIAISGLSGVGSSSTAKLVNQKLQLPMSNFTFRALAVEKGMPFEELQKLAETTPDVDFELDRRLITFINNNPDCLIVTDIACWFDQPGIYEKLGFETGPIIDYKIWLEAPLDIRAVRMHKREGGELQDVIDYNHQRDLDNRERYLKLYGIDIFDHSGVDWIFETSHLDLNQVVEQVCQRITELDKK